VNNNFRLLDRVVDLRQPEVVGRFSCWSRGACGKSASVKFPGKRPVFVPAEYLAKASQVEQALAERAQAQRIAELNSKPIKLPAGMVHPASNGRCDFIDAENLISSPSEPVNPNFDWLARLAHRHKFRRDGEPTPKEQEIARIIIMEKTAAIRRKWPEWYRRRAERVTRAELAIFGFSSGRTRRIA
jgi:hypothetical protein